MFSPSNKNTLNGSGKMACARLWITHRGKPEGRELFAVILKW